MESDPISKPYVGGQAVIEGVMMRSPRALAIAVRRQDGTIVVRDDAWVSLWEKLTFLRWPFLRGSVVLIESLYNGIQALNFAAEQAGQGGSEADPSTAPSTPAAQDTDEAKKRGLAATIAVSFVLAFALFVGLPHVLAWGAGHALDIGSGVDTFWFHALDGLFKLMIFVGYIGGISLIPEIRRVFEYHGAEHKVVNAYETGDELTVENAAAHTTFHARCGTSFVLFVLVLSMFIFAAVLPALPRVSTHEALNHLGLVLIKIPLMLPLAGFAYEINRYAAKRPGQWWVQALVLPGRWMQKLTTKEPSADQLEIALAAMRAALVREQELVTADAATQEQVLRASPDGAQVLVFRNYRELAAAIHAGP